MAPDLLSVEGVHEGERSTVAPAGASAATETFSTGCSTWTAPPGLVGDVAVKAVGSHGGTGGTLGDKSIGEAGGVGGRGAAITAALTGVRVGRQLRVCANAGGGEGGGGGASGLALGTTFSSPLVVAGVGGGGGVGTATGFSTPSPTPPFDPIFVEWFAYGALGGDVGSPGGSGTSASVTGGGGATTSAAGAAGGPCSPDGQPDGEAGGGPRAEGPGTGGDTHYGFLEPSGGGGGAGYYGGGSASTCSLAGAGGGGGSSRCTDGASDTLVLSSCAITLADPATSPPRRHHQLCRWRRLTGRRSAGHLDPGRALLLGHGHVEVGTYHYADSLLHGLGPATGGADRCARRGRDLPRR